MTKYVYAFEEGNKDMRDSLGGKGANLAEMVKIGLPVPSGFTITTEVCQIYYNNKETISDSIKKEIFDKLTELETKTGKKIGDKNNPLLVSVRSGAKTSMPGMLDTILNLGLNDEVVAGYTAITDNPRFIYDSYRRFIQMFADVVKGYPKDAFEDLLELIKNEKKITKDIDLTTEDMITIVNEYKQIYNILSGTDFPQDPKEQLLEAVTAVFRSWNNERAIYYRKINDIPAECGTAVNIQEMVFGNRNNESGTGVAFTRNPSTGERKLFGEFLMKAQGEDIVAGIRTPQPIDLLKETVPSAYKEFNKICNILENHYKDMQEIEFTIEDSKLYILQTRNGKRTAQADLKIVVDLVKEKMITKQEAILKVEPKQLENLLHPIFDNEALTNAKTIAKGLAASPGAATGILCFTAEEAVALVASGVKDIILVRTETSPEDIEGMNIVNGILTIRGGMTSHAAVVARGLGTCCVSGCDEITIDEEEKTLTDKNGKTYKAGDYLSLDGTTGNVYGEQIKTVDTEISGEFATFMEWVNKYKSLKVRANADTPNDATIALNFGTEGIGLCRTEHMFFKEERIFAIRQMIIAETVENREAALEKLLPMQRNDFEEIFRVMKGNPVTIRYLDPPLHEFLPHTDEEIEELAPALNISASKLKEHIESLKEANPMMGHRGCRLSITYPEIAVMQTRAVIEAAINVSKEEINIVPEIMIPLVGDVNELKYVKDIVVKTANEIIKNSGINLKYTIGTMIEIPRAAITADEIAKEAEFFSFGTNDLTQMTYGFSRDDAGCFLDTYYNKGVFTNNPFEELDQAGVGKLMKLAITAGKKTRKNIKLGLCGEHGGNPSSVEFCHNIGLNYVSCSPYRIPIAKLAAAQAKIKEKCK